MTNIVSLAMIIVCLILFEVLSRVNEQRQELDSDRV